ncbi:TPA: hypothetical protein DEP21_06430 [Patescibacteria group bacterium]|nr:hypothetical protein [Candidatus Gracilibacteria bacterium]
MSTHYLFLELGFLSLFIISLLLFGIREDLLPKKYWKQNGHGSFSLITNQLLIVVLEKIGLLFMLLLEVGFVMILIDHIVGLIYFFKNFIVYCCSYI